MMTHGISDKQSPKYPPQNSLTISLDGDAEVLLPHATPKHICHLNGQPAPSNEKLRRTIATNDSLVAFVSGDNPEIIVLSHHKEAATCVLRGFHSMVTDFCFVSPRINVVVSIDDGPNVWIHSIVDAGRALTGIPLGNLTFPETVSLWAIAAALPRMDADESIDCGYLLLDVDRELTAVQIGSASAGGAPVAISDVPTVSFGECHGLFAVCGDGSRLAVYTNLLVSVYLLPSPAAHTAWAPHGEHELTALSFGGVSTTVITFSNADHSVLFWDVNRIEPQCTQCIHLPWHEFRLIASPTVETLFLYACGPSVALEVRTSLVEEVKTYCVDTAGSRAPFGVCSMPVDGEQCLLVHAENGITAYMSPDERVGRQHQQGIAEENLQESHGQHSDTSTASSVDTLNHREKLPELTGSTSPLEKEDAESPGLWNDTEESLLTQTDIFHKLAQSVELVTASVIQTTKALASYQESIAALKTSASLFPPRCAKVVKKCLKERADTCLVSLDNSFEKLTADIQLPIDSKAIQTSSPSIASQLVGECMKTCEREISQLALKANRDSDNAFQMQIRKICQSSFSTMELNACVEEIDNLRNEVFSNQSSKSVIIRLLKSERYDEALGMTLEAHSTDMLLWLLTEACPLQTWSELVVDERLGPLNTFSLTYNTCVALSVGSCVYPANVSEELILLVRDTVITYKKQWAKTCDPQVYNDIRAYCCKLLQSMQKGNARGPLCSSVRETIRVIQA